MNLKINPSELVESDIDRVIDRITNAVEIETEFKKNKAN